MEEIDLNVAVIGASKDRNKFGNKAVRAYAARGNDVFPVNPREDEIEGLRCYPSIMDVPVSLDRVVVYLPPRLTLGVLDDIARKGASELYLNPGSENDDVLKRADDLGLSPMRACAIVAIGETPSAY
jgi:predicted CoA-binding protein